MTIRSKFIETTCTKIERIINYPVFRGVMSSLFPSDSMLQVLNAIAPQQRNTANLACRIWPQPSERSKTYPEPKLVVGGDNGKPFALNPVSLDTLSPLGEINGFKDIKDKKLLARKFNIL